MTKFTNKIEKLIVLILMITVFGCNFNANISHDNELSEKENAEAVTAKLYLYTSRHNVEEVQKLFGQSFFKTSGTKSLQTFLWEKQRSFGNFKSYKLRSWKTHRTTGTDPIAQYLLVYEVDYANQKAIEEISLLKENNQIMISGYHVSTEK